MSNNTQDNKGTGQLRPFSYNSQLISSYRPPTPPLTATFSTSFWKNKIPHNAPNVWWRLLINKLPSGLHLHSIILDMVEPLCHVFGTDLETSQRLLFSCPKKLEVWQAALSRYVEERTWTADYICSPFFPDPDPVKPLHDILIFILIGIILASVWRYHHAFVREDQAFKPRMVLAAVDLAITQVRAQLAKKKHQNVEGEPLPLDELLLVDNNFPT